MRWAWIWIGLLATAPAGWAAAGALGEARSALEQWVKARQMTAKTRLEWQAAKETLQAGIAMFQKELAQVDLQLATLGAGNAEIERERKALTAEKAELDAMTETARAKAEELERRLSFLLSQLPETLGERLRPLTQKLPKDPEQTRMTVMERLQTLVGILNEIDKFGSSISVESEIRKTPDEKEVEVQTLYLGLAQAYFVGEDGRFAGVGRPGKNGWEWSREEGLAPAIQKAIAIYRNQQPAAFVQLPVSVR